MSNGLPRTEKYKLMAVDEHLRQLDNDLDTNDYHREIIVKNIDRKLTWVLTTFVSLILLVCGTLLAVVIRT